MNRYIENETDFANLKKGDVVRVVVVHHLSSTERTSDVVVERVTRRKGVVVSFATPAGVKFSRDGYFDRDAGVERVQYVHSNRAAIRFAVSAANFKAQEVAYRSDRGDWKRRRSRRERRSIASRRRWKTKRASGTLGMRRGSDA